MKKASKSVATLLFALAGVAALLYLSLPVLAGWVVQHLLRTHGVSQPHVEVSRVGLDTLHVRTLRFTWNRVPVTLGPVDVTFRPTGVLEGRVATIRIEQGSIVIPAREGDARAKHFPNTLPALPILPFDTLILKALTFELPEKPAVSVEGQWQATADGVRGRMLLNGGGEERAVVAAEWQDDTFLLRLSAPGDPSSPWARLHLNRTDAGLEAEAELETSAKSLRTTFSPWWEIPTDWQGRGRAVLEGLARDSGFEGRYSTHLALKGESAWSAELNGRVYFDPAKLTLTVSEGGRVVGRGPGPQRASITFPGTFRAESRLRSGSDEKVDSPMVSGQGELIVTVAGLAERLSVKATVTDPSLMLGKAPEGQALVRAIGTVRREGKAPIEVRVAGPLRWSSGVLRWKLWPEANITIPEPYAGPSESPLRLKLEDEGEIAWRPGEGWQAGPARWRIDAPDWEAGRVRIRIGRPFVEVRQLKGERDRWEASGRFGIESLQGFIDSGELPLLGVEGRFTARPDQVAISAAADGRGVSGHLSATHRLKEQTGAAHWQLEPVVLSPDGNSLASLYEAWPFPFDVGRGEIEAGGRFQWQAVANEMHLSGDFDMEGTSLGGYFRDLLFSGADTKFWLAFDPDGVLRTRQPAPLTIENLTAGLPGHDFKSRVEFRIGPHVPLKLLLERPSVDLLGGRVRSDAIEVDFGQPVNQFEIVLERIALDSLLDLEKAQVDGLGRVSGILPIRLSEEGLSMNDGQLAAIGPGVIRYRPGEESQALEKSDQNMQLAIAALRDFHYDSLKASADYAPSGQLDLRVRLMGSNPDLFEGRSVLFNIALEENVPDLLRSLRAGPALEGQIDEWVQDFYRRRRNAKQ